ncbi:MAG: ethylbenzene dehydrogenase-related protein [Candidatus Bipolaricaulia bacterium]
MSRRTKGVSIPLLLSVGLLIVLWPVFTYGEPIVSVQAVRTDITVDGDTSDWIGIPGTAVSMVPAFGPPTRFVDVELRAAYNDDQVFILLKIQDDYDLVIGNHHLSGHIAVQFAIDAGAGPHMGTDGVNLSTSLGMVDIWHWELETSPGVLTGGLASSTGGAGGNDPDANFDDEYATTPFDRHDDDQDNKLTGAWSHTGQAGGNGTPGVYIFEMSRPLQTGDPQDLQFLIGETYQLALAYWDPDETPNGWTDAGHLQSTNFVWIALKLG